MSQRPWNVLVACEESQAVTRAIRSRGHNAFSCDLQECTGGRPDWHFKGDVFQILEQGGGKLQNGEEFKMKGKKWDLMIAHPPCTYLAVSGARWMYDPKSKGIPNRNPRDHAHPRFPTRWKDQEDAIKFVKALAQSTRFADRIVIENPVSVLSSDKNLGKPDQIVHPWQFGHEATKATCLWYVGDVPHLEATNIVGKGERVVFKSGKSQPKWYSDALKAKTTEERRTLRSKTFEGIARAMAETWTPELGVVEAG